METQTEQEVKGMDRQEAKKLYKSIQEYASKTNSYICECGKLNIFNRFEDAEKEHFIIYKRLKCCRCGKITLTAVNNIDLGLMSLGYISKEVLKE